MFCFGINSNGECLAIQIARDCTCDSSSSLFLKVKGRTYFLPVKLECLTSNDLRTFGSTRFFMQWLAPLKNIFHFLNGAKHCIKNLVEPNVLISFEDRHSNFTGKK